MHRLTLGLVALGLALMLAPTAPITARMESLPTQSLILIREPDIQLTDLPLAWQKLATCESGQRHNAVSGKRDQFQGYFQIEYPRTWKAHGGTSGTHPKNATLR